MKTKCPKSEEFFVLTPRSLCCEHHFDTKVHSRRHPVPASDYRHLSSALKRTMLSSLDLLHMLNTHPFHSNAAAMQACVCLDTRLIVTHLRCPVPRCEKPVGGDSTEREALFQHCEPGEKWRRSTPPLAAVVHWVNSPPKTR